MVATPPYPSDQHDDSSSIPVRIVSGGGGGGGGSTVVTSSTVTDYSGAKPDLGTLLATIPANTSRSGFAWQNQSAGDLQIVFYNYAGTAYTILISTGVSAGQQGDGGSMASLGIVLLGKIEIRGATGAQFMAAEF